MREKVAFYRHLSLTVLVRNDSKASTGKVCRKNILSNLDFYRVIMGEPQCFLFSWCV